MTEREIFEAAAEIDDLAARDEYVERTCGADLELRKRVVALLRSHESAGSFLESPAAKQMAAGNGSSTGEYSASAQTTAGACDVADWQEVLPAGLLEPSIKPDSLGRVAHYEVLQVLGRGAFGIVLKAFDERLHRMVAIKLMAPELATTSPARKRFLREARAAAAVRHENVVSIHSVDEQPLPYLVMEYIPGQTLQDKLDTQGPLDVAEVLRLGQQIASGLAAAHAMGLVHRDIKPANILLEAGLEERVKITDFGLARAADDASITQSGLIAGTPMYMAPEQAAGGAIDQRADLFSLGSVLYVMITGRPPFRASTTYAVLKRVTDDTPRPIHEIIPEAPAELCDIVARLHAKQPDSRFQSADQVSAALRNCKLERRAAGYEPRQSWDSDEVLRPQKPAAAVVVQGTSTSARTPSPMGWGLILLLVVLAAFVPLSALVAAGLLLGAISYTTLHATPNPPVVAPPMGAPAMAAPATAAPAVVPFQLLSSENDLTGWETHIDQPNAWRVEDGALVSSEGSPGCLYLTRDLPRDFRLRCEVKINKGGDGGIIFGAPYEPAGNEGLPGIELQVQSGPAVLRGWQTGALGRVDRMSGWQMLTASEYEMPADEWVKVELFVSGGYIQTIIGGKIVSNYWPPTRPDGRLALQRSTEATQISFRKLELLENPAQPPEVYRHWSDEHPIERQPVPDSDPAPH